MADIRARDTGLFSLACARFNAPRGTASITRAQERECIYLRRERGLDFFFKMRHGSSIGADHVCGIITSVSRRTLCQTRIFPRRDAMGINLHNIYTRTAMRSNHATRRSVRGQLISSARYIHRVCPNIWPTCPPSIDIALAIAQLSRALLAATTLRPRFWKL